MAPAAARVFRLVRSSGPFTTHVEGCGAAPKVASTALPALSCLGISLPSPAVFKSATDTPA